MRNLSHSVLKLCVLLLTTSGIWADPLSFDSRFSTFKINSGATFFNANPISNFDGTLVKACSGTITGSPITFVDGIFEDCGNELLLSAIFDPVGSLFLTGNHSFRAEPGHVLQSVTVSGINNRLEGQLIFASDLTLQDMSTSLTLAMQSQANQHILLNNGTLILENDLKFTSDKIITGPGTINGNGYQVATV